MKNKFLNLALVLFCLLLLSLFSNVAQAKTKKYGAIVRLVTKDKFSYCTGTVVDDYHIVTAFHCVSDLVGKPIFVTTANRSKLFEAEVLEIQPYMDLAVLEGDFRKFNHIPVKKKQNGFEKSKGPFIIVGYPNDGELLEFKWKPVGQFEFFVVGNGFLYKGMSGGPCIDVSTREIVGVNSRIDTAGHALISPIINMVKK